MSNRDPDRGGLSIGVDVGGSKIAIGAVTPGGEAREALRYPTDPERGPEAIIDDLVRRIRQVADQGGGEIRSLGVGICGQVEAASGVIRRSPNLPDWKDVPLRDRLEAVFGMPVEVINDAKAIAYGEWRYGGHEGVEDMVVVFVGTGVGAGVIVGGELLTGRAGHAGELGHSTIVVDGRVCPCGNAGCLEAYVGGKGIGLRAREAVSGDPQAGARLLELAEGNLDRITAETISQANLEGDALARRIVEETGHFLGAGMVGVVNGFNPSHLVLGGGVLEGLPDLVEMVAAHVDAYALEAAAEGLEVGPARLGGDSGLVGAAALGERRREANDRA